MKYNEMLPKGRVPKTNLEKVWSFAKLGGGVSEGSKLFSEPFP